MVVLNRWSGGQINGELKNKYVGVGCFTDNTVESEMGIYVVATGGGEKIKRGGRIEAKTTTTSFFLSLIEILTHSYFLVKTIFLSTFTANNF